jgi:uncharacterized protein (DUF1499 family)
MPKRLKWLTLLAISGAVTFFVLRWLVQRASPMPDNLGAENGRLAPCPQSPNCVSTQAPDEEQEHSIAPIAYEEEASTAHASILAILQADAQFTLITNTPNYIHAEAKSNLWQFIDDVEFFFDEADSLIHFRSASRLGYGDGGANRQRMEAIRAEFKAES